MTIRIIIGITLFLLSAFWARRDLRGALFFLVALLPLNHKELFSLGAWNVLPARVGLVGILAGSVLSFIKTLPKLTPTISKKIRDYICDPVLALLIFLWIIRFVSILKTKNLLASLSLLSFFTSIIGLFLLLKYCAENYGRRFLLSLLKFYLGVVLFSGVWSLLQYLFFHFEGITLPGAVWPTEYQPLRVGSFFWDINHYAAYLATAIPILGVLAAKRQVERDTRKALRSWGLFGFGLLVLGMTLSRSGWIAAFLALLLVCVLLLARAKIRVGLIFTTALLCLLAFVVLGSCYAGLPVVGRLQTFTDIYNNDSIKAHLSVLRGVWEIFRKNPIIGVGYGSFPEHFQITSEALYYFSKDPVSGVRIPAHSVWGEVLAETGILGFIPYLYLIVLIMKRIFEHFWRSQKGWAFSLGALCSIMGLLFSGIFYSYNLIFFWFFIFLAYLLAGTEVLDR